MSEGVSTKRSDHAETEIGLRCSAKRNAVTELKDALTQAIDQG